MIATDLLKKIRLIEITCRKLVHDIFAGEYESVFKGRGMEFSEVREYQPGDDVRLIDWNVTARRGTPYIKKFLEERELTVLLLVDLSASMHFGSGRTSEGSRAPFMKTKAEIASEIAGLLAFAAIGNKDKVGLIIFTDRVEKFVPPRKGPRHSLRLIREMLAFEPGHPGTDMENALKFLNDVMKRRSLVFLISDFFDARYEQLLRITGKRHDMLGMCLRDPRERDLPSVGLIRLQDNETGETTLVNLSSKATRASFAKMTAKRDSEVVRTLASSGLDFRVIDISKPFVKPLIDLLHEHRRRK
jgi:uncharacterized protein (DUF58 family)